MPAWRTRTAPYFSVVRTGAWWGSTPISPPAPGSFSAFFIAALEIVFVISFAALIYSGDLAQEVPWYVKRLQGGWEWVALAVALCNFVLPFVLGALVRLVY